MLRYVLKRLLMMIAVFRYELSFSMSISAEQTQAAAQTYRIKRSRVWSFLRKDHHVMITARAI